MGEGRKTLGGHWSLKRDEHSGFVAAGLPCIFAVASPHHFVSALRLEVNFKKTERGVCVGVLGRGEWLSGTCTQLWRIKDLGTKGKPLSRASWSSSFPISLVSGRISPPRVSLNTTSRSFHASYSSRPPAFLLPSPRLRLPPSLSAPGRPLPRRRLAPLPSPVHLRRARARAACGVPGARRRPPPACARVPHARRSGTVLRRRHRRRSYGRAAVRPGHRQPRRPLLPMPGPGRRAAAGRKMKGSAGGRREKLLGSPKAQPGRGKLSAEEVARLGWWSWLGVLATALGGEPLRDARRAELASARSVPGTSSSPGLQPPGPPRPTRSPPPPPSACPVPSVPSPASCLLCNAPRGQVAGREWRARSLRVSGHKGCRGPRGRGGRGGARGSAWLWPSPSRAGPPRLDTPPRVSCWLRAGRAPSSRNLAKLLG